MNENTKIQLSRHARRRAITLAESLVSIVIVGVMAVAAWFLDMPEDLAVIGLALLAGGIAARRASWTGPDRE